MNNTILHYTAIHFTSLTHIPLYYLTPNNLTLHNSRAILHYTTIHQSTRYHTRIQHPLHFTAHSRTMRSVQRGLSQPHWSILHSTLYNLYFTLYTLPSTLYTLNFALYTLHFTLAIYTNEEKMLLGYIEHI